MPKTSPALATPLREQLEKLAAFEPQDLPVLSLYLNLSADQHGRDSFDPFVRKVLAERERDHRCSPGDAAPGRTRAHTGATVAPLARGP